jgi:hypothetical protein
MIIERGTNTIIIGGESDYACIGVASNYYMIQGERYPCPFPRKPHDDYTVGELSQIHADLQRARDRHYS